MKGKISKVLMRKLEIAAMGIAVIVLIFAFSRFSPTARKVSSLQNEVKKMDEKIRFLKEGIQVKDESRMEQLRNLIREYNELKEMYDSSSNPVPLETDLSGFINELIQVGKKAGVEFVRVTSGKLMGYQFYQEVPIEVSVRGSFVELEKFMFGIENMNRLVKVSTFNIESNEKKPPVITAEFLLKCCVRSTADGK